MILFSDCKVLAQKGLQFNSSDSFEGFYLCQGGSSNTIYLLDHCGQIVNTWNGINPQYHCKLTEEGNLLYLSDNRIIERDWDNNIVVNIEVTVENLSLIYEVIKLENGNYLTTTRRFVNSQFLDELGWSANVPRSNSLDGVAEFDAEGHMVWEWNLGDHIIQDSFPDKSNFGIVSEHPEKVDIHSISNYDWQFEESFMFNSIDYNSELDQILISARKLNEILIIDHSTTTEEAKGSIGGKYGKGGDILYRWGNPQNYDRGSEDERILYFQHNPNWIKYGDHEGKIIVFNNGLNRSIPDLDPFSSVHIINPPIDEEGFYSIDQIHPFLPTEADITIDTLTTGTYFYSPFTSGAQVLPNGNIYITVGENSIFMEVQPNGDLAWRYCLANSSFIFRSEPYPRDFSGFQGRDLTGTGTIENPSSEFPCVISTSISYDNYPSPQELIYDHASTTLYLNNENGNYNELIVRNGQGQVITLQHYLDQTHFISFENYPPGLYFITLSSNKTYNFKTQKIIKL